MPDPVFLICMLIVFVIIVSSFLLSICNTKHSFHFLISFSTSSDVPNTNMVFIAPLSGKISHLTLSVDFLNANAMEQMVECNIVTTSSNNEYKISVTNMQTQNQNNTSFLVSQYDQLRFTVKTLPENSSYIAYITAFYVAL